MSTKSKILASALERFLKQGHEHVSMRQIAGDVGVTPMAIYKHFANKEALQVALLEAGYQVFEDYLGRFVKGEKARERLILLAEGFFDFSIEQPGYFELIFLSGRSLVGIKGWEEAKNASRPTYRALHQCIRDCIAEDIIVDGDLKATTTSMLAFCVGISALYLSGSVGWTSRDARSKFFHAFDTYLNQLSPPPVRSKKADQNGARD